MISAAEAEQWCTTIPNFSRYKLSNHGTLMHQKSKVPTVGRLGDGQKTVVRIFNDQGERRNLFIHYMVAKAFVPNPNGYKYANYINELGNNHYTNIRWTKQMINSNRKAYISQEGEVWKSINADYEGSSLANVRNIHSQQLLTPQECSEGYAYITMKKYGTHKRSILIAKLFLTNPDNKPTVDHINRVRMDDRVENLSWATYAEQRHNQKGREKGKWGIITTTKIKRISIEDETDIVIYNNIHDVISFVIDNNLYDVNQENIHNKIRKRFYSHMTKPCFGYMWEYLKAENYEGEEWKLFRSIFPTAINNHCSNYGRIKNEAGHILQGFNNHGYRLTYIGEGWKDSDRIHVHILVALLFVEKPDDYEDDFKVNHLDGDKQNDIAENLEWCTHTANIQHAHDTGLYTKNKIRVYNIATKEETFYFNSKIAAEKLGLSHNYLKQCARPNNHLSGKAYGGYLFTKLSAYN